MSINKLVITNLAAINTFEHKGQKKFINEVQDLKETKNLSIT